MVSGGAAAVVMCLPLLLSRTGTCLNQMSDAFGIAPFSS
jgi:hypothetical protein